MRVTKLIAGIIYLEHGDYVTRQFLSVYEEGESLDEQNPNALKYILITIKKVSESKLIKDESYLESIIEELEQYLN